MKIPINKTIFLFLLRILWIFIIFLSLRSCFLSIFQEKKFDFEKATKIVKYIQKNNIKNWTKHLKNNPNIGLDNKNLCEEIAIQDGKIIFQTASFMDDIVGYIYAEDTTKIHWKVHPIQKHKNWYFGEVFLK